jgi:RNA ligase
MTLNIKDFYAHPQVMSREWNDLVLFCYTRECQFDSLWDDITMAARGLIFNKVTGEVVARVFTKFFNAAELTGKIDLYELAKKPFVALKKMDGSFAIHFQYEGQDYIATKGSFSSDQAVWATEWFRNHIRSSEMLKTHTYLFEMIYPENKIVVDYGDTEDLVLLGVLNKETGEEMPYAALKEEGKRIGATVVEAKEFNSLDELYEYCKGLPATEEGFVINFHNGQKVKVKGDEYCKIHRILSHMTPLAFWNAWDMEEKDIPKGFMVVMPEEFREVTDLLYKQIYDLHWNEFNKIEESYKEIMKRFPPDIDHKTLFLTGKELYPKQINDMMFYHKGKFHKIWVAIHRRVRPTFNVLPDSVAGADRLKRILEET